MSLKIGIYNEPPGVGVGGAENLSATLCEALLAHGHGVELLHRIPSLTARRLAENSGLALDGLRLRYVDTEAEPPPLVANPRRRYAAERQRHAWMSEPFDVFVAVVHRTPPFCHAGLGALIVLFPGMAAPYVSLRGGVELGEALRRPAGFLYHGWEWRRRMESYRVKTAISEFSRAWARRRWGIDCEVINPPVDVNFRRVEKENTILSVGRFALDTEGHTKSQAEMVAAFRQMEEEGLRGWEYHCVGGLGDTPEHRAYFGRLVAQGAGGGVRLAANLGRGELKRLFERAAVFWHASGYGHDEEADPVRAEHFGISTAEAMAAGCVPVVVNRGGQREIVEHGVSGFLWETLEELKDYTGRLVADVSLRARMAEAARARAQRFSRETFAESYLRRLVPASAAAAGVSAGGI